jgi:hypothetical protein
LKGRLGWDVFLSIFFNINPHYSPTVSKEKKPLLLEKAGMGPINPNPPRIVATPSLKKNKPLPFEAMH